MKAKAKGHIYENEEARIRYEDLYSKNWYVQNRLDVSVRPDLKGQYRTGYLQSSGRSSADIGR